MNDLPPPHSDRGNPEGDPEQNAVARKIEDAYAAHRDAKPPADLWSRIEAAATSRSGRPEAGAHDAAREKSAARSRGSMRARLTGLRSQLVAASIGFVGFWTAIGLMPGRESSPPSAVSHGLTEISRLIPELNTSHPAAPLDWFPELQHLTDALELGAVLNTPEPSPNDERRP